FVRVADRCGTGADGDGQEHQGAAADRGHRRELRVARAEDRGTGVAAALAVPAAAAITFLVFVAGLPLALLELDLLLLVDPLLELHLLLGGLVALGEDGDLVAAGVERDLAGRVDLLPVDLDDDVFFGADDVELEPRDARLERGEGLLRLLLE